MRLVGAALNFWSYSGGEKFPMSYSNPFSSKRFTEMFSSLVPSSCLANRPASAMLTGCHDHIVSARYATLCMPLILETLSDSGSVPVQTVSANAVAESSGCDELRFWSGFG